MVKIRLLDSMRMLDQKLSDLCKTFNVEVVKGVFPHKFASDKTLFYKGDTPNP